MRTAGFIGGLPSYRLSLALDAEVVRDRGLEICGGKLGVSSSLSQDDAGNGSLALQAFRHKRLTGESMQRRAFDYICCLLVNQLRKQCLRMGLQLSSTSDLVP